VIFLDKIFTVKQVAESLQVPQITVTKWIREGKIKAFKVGKEWRITETNFNEYMKNNSNI
jgi:excisionase family DNA binding protein